MVKALWISRHPLDAEAKNALLKLYGNDLMIETKDIVFSADGETALTQLKDASSNYDLIGGVFPAQLWVGLLRHNQEFKKTLFIVVSKEAPAKDGQARVFMFDHLEIFNQ
ncbi:MAG: hypothetical protein QXV17_01460 [Candidatus Micrarchaeaceae archaeon]